MAVRTSLRLAAAWWAARRAREPVGEAAWWAWPRRGGGPVCAAVPVNLRLPQKATGPGPRQTWGHRVAETDAESTPQVGRSGAAAAAALGTNRGYGCAPPARAHFICRTAAPGDNRHSTVYAEKMSLTFFLLVDMWGLQFQYSSLLLALNE